jgi:type IV pilus assembly protein PilA
MPFDVCRHPKFRPQALGVISVTLQNVATGANGKKLILSPTKDAAVSVAAADGDTILGWHCGTDADAADYKFFPASCRQAALGGP